MIGRYWVEFWLNNGAAWYGTYLLYSTWVFGAIILAVKWGRVSATTENALWRGAVGIVPILSVVRIAAEHVDTWTVAAGPDIFTVAGTLGWALIGGVGASLVAGLWLTGRLGRAAWSERRQLSSRTPVRDGQTVDQLEQLARAAGRPMPRLTESDRLRAPIAIGGGEICLPVPTFAGLSQESARAVLAHELGHLMRRDTPWAAWVHLLDRIFFLQPLQRWASRRIRETAEFLADDFAVRHSAGPEHLVGALTTFARAPGPGIAVSGFAPGSLLVRRVERVLSGTGSEGRVGPAVLVLFLGALATLIWFSPAVVPACDCRLQGVIPLFELLLGAG